MSQKYYEDLVKELGSDEEAEKHIAKRLRELADIVESDDYPRVFGWSDEEKFGKVLPMMSVTLTLSYPWPG
jgi:RecJ-like exonuclease